MLQLSNIDCLDYQTTYQRIQLNFQGWCHQLVLVLVPHHAPPFMNLEGWCHQLVLVLVPHHAHPPPSINANVNAK